VSASDTGQTDDQQNRPVCYQLPDSGSRPGGKPSGKETIMSEQLAISVQPDTKLAPAKTMPSQDPFERMQELHDSIARCAFEAFKSRGKKNGYDFDDWIKAESELLHPVHLDLSESDNAITVRVEVPGFSAQDLKVRVDGRLVTISGKRETSEERKTRKTIYTERCSNEVFRQFNLPAEAETAKIQATLEKGVLEFVMPKIGESQAIPSGDGHA
jgi:HSP20 family protein